VRCWNSLHTFFPPSSTLLLLLFCLHCAMSRVPGTTLSGGKPSAGGSTEEDVLAMLGLDDDDLDLGFDEHSDEDEEDDAQADKKDEEALGPVVAAAATAAPPAQTLPSPSFSFSTKATPPSAAAAPSVAGSAKPALHTANSSDSDVEDDDDPLLSDDSGSELNLDSDEDDTPVKQKPAVVTKTKPDAPSAAVPVAAPVAAAAAASPPPPSTAAPASPAAAKKLPLLHAKTAASPSAATAATAPPAAAVAPKPISATPSPPLSAASPTSRQQTPPAVTPKVASAPSASIATAPASVTAAKHASADLDELLAAAGSGDDDHHSAPVGQQQVELQIPATDDAPKQAKAKAKALDRGSSVDSLGTPDSTTTAPPVRVNEVLSAGSGASSSVVVGLAGASPSASSEPLSEPEYAASRTHCPLCQTLFDLDAHLPVLLHAGHSFCASCALSDARLQPAGKEVLCPVCGVGVQAPSDAGARSASLAAARSEIPAVDDSTSSALQLPVNFLLRDALEVATLDSSANEEETVMVVCAKCDDAAVAKCRTCEAFVCAFHEQDHIRSRDTAAHVLQSMADFLAAQPAAVHTKMYCGTHPAEEVALYCLECAVPICRRCAQPGGGSVHAPLGSSAHPVEDLSVAALRQAAELKRAAAAAGTKALAVTDAMASVQKVASKVVEQEVVVAEDIRAACAALRRLLDQREAALLSSLDTLASGKRATLDKQHRALSLQARSLRDAKEEVDDMLQAVGAVEVDGATAAAEADESLAAASAQTSGARKKKPRSSTASIGATSGATPSLLTLGADGKSVSGTAKVVHMHAHLLASLEAMLAFQPAPLQPEESAQFAFNRTISTAALAEAATAATPTATPAAAPTAPTTSSPRRRVRGVTSADAAASSPSSSSSAVAAPVPAVDPALGVLLSRVGALSDSTPHASYCTASGPGLSQAASVRTEARFTVQLRDRFRQAKTTGGDPLAVEFLGAARGTATGRVIDRGDGKYTVRYLCVTPGTYSLQVSLAGAHISGSPFKITVQASNATSSGGAAAAAGGPTVGSTWVASLGGRGSKEGQLMNPLGMAVSAEGLFVSDYANARICVFNLQPPHALVRCIGKGGAVPALSPTSAAGSSLDAAASSPSSSSLTSLLRNPWSVAVDPLSGELFVSDSGASKILVFASATGEFLRAFGGVVGSSGGGGGVSGGTNAAGGRFRHPAGLAIYTPPAMLQQHLQQQQQGNAATVTPAVTASPLNGVAATPLSPTSSSTLASTLSTQQLLFVCDRDKHRMQCFDLQGRLLRTWGSNGSGAGQFLHPSGVAVSVAPLGNNQQQPLVYVCDSSNHRVQVFTLSGSFVSMFGTRGAAPGQFLDPQGVLVLQTPVPTPPTAAPSSSSTGADGQTAQSATGTNGGGISFVTQVLVADQSNHRVQAFSASGSFLRLVGSQAGGRTAERGQLVKPAGLALAAVRKSDGAFVPMMEALLAGVTADSTADAKATAAAVPQTVLFVSDTASHRVQVFK
jgi:hypothetical protein